MKPETIAVHAGAEPDATGALSPPLHFATTFRHGPAGEREGGYEYLREGGPTLTRLEDALAALEQGQRALAFASGMGSVSALLGALPAGSEILIPEDVYHGVRVLAAEILPAQGITARAVAFDDIAAVRAACTPATRLLWAETPSNPGLRVADLAALAEIARRRGAWLAVDNTFATPVLQNPIALGAHVVMHSTTKYIGGHSDVLGGALVFAGADTLWERATHRRQLLGAAPAPFNAWLTLRGLRSLPARMAWHCRNAARVAEFLAGRAEVAVVHYPGLPGHAGHAVAARQMRDFGGMVSFEAAGGRAAALAIAGRLKLFTNATSLGGCESLVEHRASVEGPAGRSPPGLLRLSVGLEHPDDLVEDLAQALG